MHYDQNILEIIFAVVITALEGNFKLHVEEQVAELKDSVIVDIEHFPHIVNILQHFDSIYIVSVPPRPMEQVVDTSFNDVNRWLPY